MKTFRNFLNQLKEHAPIIPVEATKFDLNDIESVQEVNKNLDTVLSVGFSNVYEAFNKVRKVLSMYKIELPRVTFGDDKSGKIEMKISQKDISGEDFYTVTPPNNEINSEDKVLTFSYFIDNGIYRASAEFK